MASLILSLIIGFLLGGIPFGLWSIKLLYKKDIREYGSGNIGATNIFRAGYKKLGLATFIFDASKSIISFYLTKYLLTNSSELVHAPELAALAAVVGQMFSIFLCFTGGKGISAFFGFCFVSGYKLFFIAGLTWIIVLSIWRYISVASLSMVFLIMSIFSFELIYLIDHGWSEIILYLAGIFVGLLIMWKHRSNIKNLISGLEPKVGKIKK